MPAVVDIVNTAMRFIGADAIGALSDTNKRAQVADDLYTETLQDLLRSHNWNFATKRQKLARLSSTPAFQYDYAYSLPSDWIRSISVHDNDGGYGTCDYREELVGTTRVIASDIENCYLRYVYYCQDPNQMDPAFRRALAAALARDMAPAIPNSAGKEDRNDKRATQFLARAKSYDALGGSPEERPSGSWVDSRMGRWRTNRVWPA